MAKITTTGGLKHSGGSLVVKRTNIPPVWDTLAGSLGTPLENEAFSVNPGATDPDTFPNLNITYSVVSEAGLPTGLFLNTSTGEISGTTDPVGSDTVSNFTLRAADGEIGANKPGKFDERDFSITVLNNDPPSFDQVPNFSLGSVAELAAASLFQITATDDHTDSLDITFSEVGAVLAANNLSIDSSGNVTGSPPDNGGTRVVIFTVRADDGVLTADQDYNLTITDSQDPIWVTAIGALAAGSQGTAYSEFVEATDDNTIAYSVTSGALPAGTTLNSSTGEISGTPTTSESAFFEITATDTVELDATARSFSIEIALVIVNSLRFNDDDSATLTRTPSGAGNRRKWTFSTWIKRSNLAEQRVFAAGTAGNINDSVRFENNHTLRVFFGGVTDGDVELNRVFRDTSAWYHIVVGVDTEQGTASNRVKIYVNGIQETDFFTTNYPSLNYDTAVNNNVEHRIGARTTGSGTEHFDGYLSETVFVDGTQLTPSSFGAFDANGDWQPIDVSGLAFGTNGFHLDYAIAPDTNTNTTSAGLDVSGNGNNWTESASLTASDQVSDTPTNNYCTWNPLNLTQQSGSVGLTLSDGNLKAGLGSSDSFNKNVSGTLGMPLNSGKWYFEGEWSGFNMTTQNTIITFGIRDALGTIDGISSTASASFLWRPLTGVKVFTHVGGSGSVTLPSLLSEGDVMQIAYDSDTGEVWAGINNTYFNSSGGTTGNPSAGTNPTITFSVFAELFPIMLVNNLNPAFIEADFGQRGFAFTPPTGFLALNTNNLPTPTIENPSDYFDIITYTGNGTSLNTNTIKALDFAPNFVWIKQRTNVNGHSLNDTIRGTTTSLSSNSQAAENNFNTITAFNSDGYTAGTSAQTNSGSASYVAWCWNESATPGFDIVAYTGTGSAHTEAHSLSAVPDMMIVKGRTNTFDWRVYHSSNTVTPETDQLKLNLTAATAVDVGAWNDTAPTSSVFTVGVSAAVNQNTADYIAYLWAEVEGFSKFGSYTGNASTDGPFVWCGFRPAYVLIKQSDAIRNWIVKDTARDLNNLADTTLEPNTSDEDITNNGIDILSNGFKMRTAAAATNASNGTYIFAAFAESPFKTARAR